MSLISIGIIGGAGYTAGELLRILLHHPQADIRFVHSTSQAGRPLTSIHQDLIGETDLVFTDEVETDVDAIFLCSGHGRTRPFLESVDLPDSVRIIDLSNEFRMEGPEHDFVYGLPEWQRDRIRSATRIANPGCFATCIQLALLPLAANGGIHADIHVNAITGSTGAGQKPGPTTHFSWRNNNMSVYKAFTHQHLPEIYQSTRRLHPHDQEILFLPHRGDFPRGIFATTTIRSDWSQEEALQRYQEYYEEHPFTHVSLENPHLKQVVNTNKAVVHVHKHEHHLLIISMIDNLLKGASGQAVQNFNLMFGLDETVGLNLKSLGF